MGKKGSCEKVTLTLGLFFLAAKTAKISVTWGKISVTVGISLSYKRFTRGMQLL